MWWSSHVLQERIVIWIIASPQNIGNKSKVLKRVTRLARASNCPSS
ncbi:hypothetical protein HanOQP8_Chr08g0292051 [Helianthus annuus]|nr:hypothetical protein HanOQP8_Chr08g0292051 [Helianthus annuus]